MPKSPDAFRTISEVADWLGIQSHVLRFWESKFTQVKPVKRAGGRRYYRPADMLLLGGIKQLLHEDGLTIKGVQKVLREDGMNHVSSLSQPLDDDADAPVDAPAELPVATPDEETGVVLNFESPTAEPVSEAPSEPLEIDTAMDAAPALATEKLPEAVAEPAIPPEIDPESEAPEPSDLDPERIAAPAPELNQPETMVETPAENADEDIPTNAETQTPDEPAVTEQAPAAIPEQSAAETLPETAQTADEMSADTQDGPDTSPERTQAHEAETDTPAESAPRDSADLPAFLREPLTPDTLEPQTDNPAPEPTPLSDVAAASQSDAAHQDSAQDETPTAPAPRQIEMPILPSEGDFDVSYGVLAGVYRRGTPSPEAAAQMRPLLERLTELRDAMAARRGAGSSGA